MQFATRVALIRWIGALALSAACSGAPPFEPSDGGRVDRGDGGAPSGLQAMGSAIVDGSGNAVTFRGVNRSGTEYECVQGRGIFDGPSDAAWDAWGGCGDDLISDYSGTPTAYGLGYRNHLLGP